MRYYLKIIYQINTYLLQKLKLKVNPYYLLFFIFQIFSYSIFGLLSISYSMNWWTPRVWIDEYIPLTPFFIPIYLIYYPVLIAPIFLPLTKFKDKQLAVALFLSSWVNYLVSFTIISRIQPRVPILGYEGIWIDTLKWLYTVDFNALYFPSLHVAHSCLIGLILWKWKTYRMIFLILAVPISISTIFVKQHFILDIVSAILIVGIIYKVVSYFGELSPLNLQKILKRKLA